MNGARWRKGWLPVLFGGGATGVIAWLSGDGDGDGSTVPVWLLPALAGVVAMVGGVVWLMIRGRG